MAVPEGLTTLNSNLILLIPIFDTSKDFSTATLNSNLILLIRHTGSAHITADDL